MTKLLNELFSTYDADQYAERTGQSAFGLKAIAALWLYNRDSRGQTFPPLVSLL